MSYIVYFYPKVASYYSNLVSLYLSTQASVVTYPYCYSYRGKCISVSMFCLSRHLCVIDGF